MSCGKCKALGALAPCDECYYRGGMPAPVAPPPASPGLRFSPSAEAHLDALESASPEPMPEGLPPTLINIGSWHQDNCWIQLETLRALLATQGLTVVTDEQHAKLGILNDPALCWAALESEMNARGYKFVDAASAKVLEASAALEEATMQVFARANPNEDYGTRWSPLECQVGPVFKAELDRREKEKT